MKPFSTALAAAIVCLTLAKPAWAEMISKQSSHEQALEGKDIMVAARIDHAANTETGGATLPPT